MNNLTPKEKRLRTRQRRKNPLRAAKLVKRVKVVEKVDWTALRPEILKKSCGCCYLCGRPLTLETMTTDHCTIEPMGAKKNNDFRNLMACCGPCNNRKGSRRIDWGVTCECGQMIQITGLPCLQCERLSTTVTRHSEHEL